MFARLKKKSIHSPSASQHSQSHAPPVTPIRHPMPGAWSESSPLQRKIHPDLNSLLIEDSTHILDIGPVAQNDTALGFVPLPPSTRKRSTSLKEVWGDNLDDQKAKATRQPLQDRGQRAPSYIPFTTSFPETSLPAVDASSPNTSGETFGRATKLTSLHGQETSHVVSDTTPVTPDSSSSPAGSHGTRAHSFNLSFESRSNSSHKLESITPSPHTFGIPTPPSSGFALSPRRRRVHASSETAPPLPPLDHPAFQLSPVSSNVVNSRAMRIFTVPSLPIEKDNQQSKHPRHVSSLPSMSLRALSSMRSPNHSRERAKTQSRLKTQDIFPSTSPLHSTPRRSFRHSRTKSKDSTNSSRRASAEFSAAQATLTRDDTGTAESWEAQVSREMIRMALGETPARTRSGIQNNTAVAESGQARGNSVWEASVKTSALGSPFLLQQTPNLSGTAHHENTPASNLVSAENKAESNIPPDSRDDALSPFSDLVTGSAMGPGQPPSPKRTRTPSPPPPKINTIPHPVPGGTSSSNLMPPSLSFTAPTPEASPISPISTGHQHAATEPSQSVLNPIITPIVRSASSGHKGKRKADEADDGGSTPPKDQPRATFAVEPRPHRASGNSASSRATNSGSSRAPSSYHRKRARLSSTPEVRPSSRASGDGKNQNAGNTGSWSSKASSRNAPQPPPATYQHPHRAPSRRSLSQASVHGSIPISALISPHAPSIQGSSVFHMRDPRKPPPIQRTPWSLSLPSGGHGRWLERGGSPLHAWLFFIGFLIFPIWWAAAFVGIPRTRRLGGNEVEKGVILDDPQVEYDANSWRKRCRIMAVVSLFTYIPFIILVAIFVR